MAPHREVVVEPSQPIKFSIGTIVAIITAAFVLGTTFTHYAMKFETLTDRVDKLTTAVEMHLGGNIAAAASKAPSP
jgi:hypothetical protein